VSESKIILFPQNRIVKRNEIDEETKRNQKKIEKQQIKSFCEEVVDSIALDILRKCVELGVRTKRVPFIKDFAFLVDSVRAMLYRDFNLNHITQKIVDKTVTLNVNSQGQQVANINYSNIIDLKKKTKPFSDEVNKELDDLQNESDMFEPDFDLDD